MRPDVSRVFVVTAVPERAFPVSGTARPVRELVIKLLVQREQPDSVVTSHHAHRRDRPRHRARPRGETPGHDAYHQQARQPSFDHAFFRLFHIALTSFPASGSAGRLSRFTSRRFFRGPFVNGRIIQSDLKVNILNETVIICDFYKLFVTGLIRIFTICHR